MTERWAGDHSIVADEDGLSGRIECKNGPDAWCHTWPDCMVEGECVSGGLGCEHPETRHAECLIVEWAGFVGDLQDMQDDPAMVGDRLRSAPIEVTRYWDEDGPTWRYDEH